MPGTYSSDLADCTRCGLYIHIPFCKAKCGYCDFFSVPFEGLDSGALLSRLANELRTRLADNSYSVDTLFLGGGTPTALPRRQLAALLEVVSALVPPGEVTEFTVEANPATVNDEVAELLVAAGVTRVSMGAQSFNRDELVQLDRLHSPADISPSVAVLRRHGVAQVSLDLIFGIPGQTLETFAESLRRAIELGVEHIACYGLTYEPGTKLTALRDQGHITPCDEQLEADMFMLAMDALPRAGFEQYEISNYARPGCRCQHNLIYWHDEPYIGVGPAAAGYLGNRRYKNISDLNEYIRMIDDCGKAEIESEIIDVNKLMTELIMMQLRLVEGLSIELFRERTGVDPLTLLAGVLDRFVDQGLLVATATHIAPTRQGLLVNDLVIRELAAACDR